MNLKEIIIDSVKYSLKGGYNFLILGFIVVFLEFYEKIAENFPYLYILFLIVAISLIFIEGGYLAKIIGESIYGNNDLPKFGSLKSLFINGIKETIILTFYALIFLVTFLLIFLFIRDSLILGILIVINIIFMVFILFLAEGSIINHSLNHHNLKSAFDFRKIFTGMKSIGIANFALIIIFIWVIAFLIEGIVPGFVEFNTPLLFIVELLTIPFSVIFSSRLMGLIGRYHFKK
ncbi:MAG: DUF4013 domain-containing protein [Methanobacteriaceae archaeon]